MSKNQKTKAYLSQLNKYLSDCPETKKELIFLEYELKGMEKVFRQYYACIENENYFSRVTEKITQKTGVVGGLSLSNLNFNSSSFDYLTKATFTPSVNLVIGGSYEVVFPKKLKKFSLYNEVLYSSSYKIEGELESIISPTNYDNNYTEIKFSYLNINSMVSTRINKSERMQLRLNLGMAVGFALSHSTKRIREIRLSSTSVDILEYEAIEDPSKQEFGFIGGIKSNFSKLSFEIRYQYRLGMSPFPALRARRNVVSLLVGYNLKTWKRG